MKYKIYSYDDRYGLTWLRFYVENDEKASYIDLHYPFTIEEFEIVSNNFIQAAKALK